jgi:F0F1-type ATP synthase assembly protein I
MADNRPATGPNFGMGFAVVGSEMVGFTLLGVGLDYLTNGWPWGTAGLTLLGVFVALWHLSRIAASMGQSGGAA